MDVTCTRCGTDYEFEETLISTRGTTVKCTNCGHLFKVFRPEDSEPSATEEARTQWTLRRPDGTSEKLASLAELTRRIVEGQLAEEDQISRSGQAWKRLGDIDELRSFFAQGRSGRPPGARARGATPALGLNPPKPMSGAPSLPIGVGSSRPPRPTSSDGSSTPPPPPAPGNRSVPPPSPRFESMGASVALDSGPPGSAAAPSARPAPPAAASSAQSTRPGPLQAAPASTPSAEPTTSREPPRAGQDSEPPRGEGGATAVAQADDIVLPQRRSSAALWVALVLLVAGGSASAWLALRRPDPATPAKDSVTLQLDEADAALASHRRARFNDGVVAYGKALAAYPIDPHVLSSISRTYAVWAQESWFDLDDLAQRDTPAPIEHEQRLRAELQRLSGLAREFAERAARKNPGNEEAEVALADALRLGGNLVSARSELDRARATQAKPDAETLRVAALLAIAEAHGDMSAGRAFAEQAVKLDPELIRTRVLLARILAAVGEPAGAKGEVDALRVLDPEHPLLPELTSVLARAQARVRAEEEAKRLAAEAAALATADAEATEAEGESNDYRELVKRGEAMLERGAVAQAKQTFTKALALQPRGAEAKTGLGYVALENGSPELAIRLFRGPASDAYPDALIGLGDAYRRLGRLRDALQQYRAYERRYPQGQRASIARRQIDLLQEQINDP